MKLWLKILGGLTFSLALAVTAGLVMIGFSQETLQHEVIDSANLVSEELIREIDRDIYHRLEQVQQYGKNLEGEQLLLISNQRFAELKNKDEHIKQVDEAWQKGRASSTKEQVLSNQLSQKLKENLQRNTFYEESEGYHLFPEVFVTNKYGAVVAATNETSDYYQADEEWWQKAKQNGFYVGEMRHEPSTGKIAMDLVVRLEDKSDNFLGILTVVLNGKEISSMLENLKIQTRATHEELNKSGELHLLDKNNKVIYCTAGHDFGKDFPYDYCQETNGECKEFVKAKSKKGEEILLTHAHSQGYEKYAGKGWTLVMHQRTEEVFGPIRTMRRNLLVIILIASAVILVVDFLVAKTIAAPEEELRKRKEQLEKFARLSEGREKRMIELKKKINELQKKLGKEPTFDVEDIEVGGRLKEKEFER